MSMKEIPTHFANLSYYIFSESGNRYYQVDCQARRQTFAALNADGNTLNCIGLSAATLEAAGAVLVTPEPDNQPHIVYDF